MIKAFLFDADKVVIPISRYFSEVYSESFDVPSEKLIEFFKNEFRQCVIGKLDIKEILPKYLKSWNWNKSVDEFLEYWFESENKIDHELIKLIEKLKKKDFRCILLSNQEKYRADFIKNKMIPKDLFKKMYFSCDYQLDKQSPEFLQIILKENSLKPEEVIHIDDGEEFLKVSKDLGFETFLFRGADKFEKYLKEKEFIEN